MIDPNFEFLVDAYPICYTYCKRMDSYIFYEAYEEAAVNARKAVEGIVRITDKHFNQGKHPGPKRRYFMDYVNDLYYHDRCDTTIRDYIMNIWRNCGNAAHPTNIEYHRSDLNNYAKQTQMILLYFYNLIENSNVDFEYNVITGEEEWIVAQLMKRVREVKDLRVFQDELKRLEKMRDERSGDGRHTGLGRGIVLNSIHSNKPAENVPVALGELPSLDMDGLDEEIQNKKQLIREQLEFCVEFDAENISF